jgi:hypothetical protein
MSWRTEAACKGQPTEWFYSTKYAARALIVCNDCPVRRPCNQEAEQAGEEFGVWGGTAVRLRRNMPVERVNVRAILTAELEGAENWVYARELAARLGLNRNTVQKVLGRMVDAGVLETRMAGTTVKQWRWRQQQEEVAC